MVAKKYIPDSGDLVWVDLDPTKGREQAKVRPAIVVSPKSYNAKTSLALMCPVTSVQKGYPFEVMVTKKNVKGVILADHIRSLDWNSRKVTFIAKADAKTIALVRHKLLLLIQ